MNELCVYHGKRSGFVGDRLYPLNTLKKVLPEVYEREARKYKGREWLLDVAIPGMDALWNDVLHFSLVHPRVILGKLAEAGFDYRELELNWIEIPLKSLPALPGMIYLNTRIWQETRTLLPSDLEPVRPERVRELSGMPEANMQYYRDCKAKGEHPVFWKRAPHLFLKGELEISSFRTFDWRD